jgi:hypothetical protein
MKGNGYLLRPAFFVRAAGRARVAVLRATVFFAGAFFADAFLATAVLADAFLAGDLRAGFAAAGLVAADFGADLDERVRVADGSWYIRIRSKPSCVAR